MQRSLYQHCLRVLAKRKFRLDHMGAGEVGITITDHRAVRLKVAVDKWLPIPPIPSVYQMIEEQLASRSAELEAVEFGEVLITVADPAAVDMRIVTVDQFERPGGRPSVKG